MTGEFDVHRWKMFRNAQCEGPVGQGTGLYGKEEGNLVERADLVVPLNEGPAWWVVWGWELEIPRYPIRLPFCPPLTPKELV